MSAIKKPQEQEANDVAATEKKIKSAEVCEELTSSDDKDDDAAIPQLYEGVEEPVLKRRGNCQSEYECSSCD